MLIRTHQLDFEQLRALEQLSAECKQHDENNIAMYRHLLDKARPTPCNVLYYKKDKLIGFLRPFFFYENACEIAVMVHPDFRRQGISFRMLQEIQLILNDHYVENIIFSVPQGLYTSWLTQFGLSYQGSEYQMQYCNTTLPLLEEKRFNIRPANHADIPTLCMIDKACFPLEQEDMPLRFYSLLADSGYTILMISLDGIPVGKAHILWQSDAARLSDIAVLPKAQGQGLGSAIINYCIAHVLKTNIHKIVLDVETNNRNALNIYRRLGFTINNAHDYWNMPPIVWANLMRRKT